jgi:hypothetical protein
MAVAALPDADADADSKIVWYSRLMPVSSVLIWAWNDLRCVAVRYTDPPMLAVQVWQGEDTLVDKACVDAADAATEADRLLDRCCSAVERTEHSRASDDWFAATARL